MQLHGVWVSHYNQAQKCLQNMYELWRCNNGKTHISIIDHYSISMIDFVILPLPLLLYDTFPQVFHIIVVDIQYIAKIYYFDNQKSLSNLQ